MVGVYGPDNSSINGTFCSTAVVHAPGRQSLPLSYNNAGPKYFVSEMVWRVADRAVQIHGGAGYMRGVAVERFYRDARLFRIYEGTNQVQQVIIATHLLGDAARA